MAVSYRTSRVSPKSLQAETAFVCLFFNSNIYVRIEKQGPDPPHSPFQLLTLLLLSREKHSVYLGFTYCWYTLLVATVYLIISYIIKKKIVLFHVPPFCFLCSSSLLDFSYHFCWLQHPCGWSAQFPRLTVSYHQPLILHPKPFSSTSLFNIILWACPIKSTPAPNQGCKHSVVDHHHLCSQPAFSSSSLTITLQPLQVTQDTELISEEGPSSHLGASPLYVSSLPQLSACSHASFLLAVLTSWLGHPQQREDVVYFLG